MDTTAEFKLSPAVEALQSRLQSAQTLVQKGREMMTGPSISSVREGLVQLQHEVEQLRLLQMEVRQTRAEVEQLISCIRQ